ncbi:MAG: hypothetical protein OHK0015_15970 [Chloroflexi bacterium OHK40]
MGVTKMGVAGDRLPIVLNGLGHTVGLLQGKALLKVAQRDLACLVVVHGVLAFDAALHSQRLPLRGKELRYSAGC